MKSYSALGVCVSSVALAAASVCFSAPSPEEQAAIEMFEEAGARLTLDNKGHVIKLFSGGNPPHSVEALQQIAAMENLEELALNSPAAGNDDWGFLQELKQLRKLTIWHGKYFSGLEPFSDLPIESLTVGGCMGLRDLNKDEPEKQRDAVLTLSRLPKLKSLTLYHSPLAPADVHLAHIVENFPQLEDLRLDFNAPRGFETTTTPAGLADLNRLPLKVLSLENVNTFTPEHMSAVAGIETLESLLIDARKNPFDTAPLVSAVVSIRPGLDIQVAGADAKGPPRPSSKP